MTSSAFTKQLTDALEVVSQKPDESAKRILTILDGLRKGWRYGYKGSDAPDQDWERWSFLEAFDGKEGFWAKDFIDSLEEAQQGYPYYGGMYCSSSHHYPKLVELSSAACAACPTCGKKAVAIMHEEHTVRVSDKKQTYLLCVGCEAVNLVSDHTALSYYHQRDRLSAFFDDD